MLHVLATFLSWKLQHCFPESSVAFAAVLTVTTSTLVTVCLSFLHCIKPGEPLDKETVECLVATESCIVTLSGVTGIVLLVATVVTASSQLDDPREAITCGVLAVVSVIVAVVTNCATVCGLLERVEDIHGQHIV